MTDQELLEWYKNNSSSKPADMSQQDYELNMNKAVKLQQDKLLQDNYNTQQAAILKSQRDAEQSASISNDKLMKYLGQSQLASGIAKGQTTSDFIKANNSYVANRANITANSAQQQTELLNSYASNKLANETDAYNNNIAILDKYRQRDIEDKQIAQSDELHNINVTQGNLKNEALKKDMEYAEQNQLWSEEDRETQKIKDQLYIDSAKKDMEYAEQNQNMNKQQWELEMDAYRQELQNTLEDRNASKEEKIKAEQDANDQSWFTAASNRIDKIILQNTDKSGNITNSAKQLIYQEVEKYKDKFNSDKYYQWLLDYANTEMYPTSSNSVTLSSYGGTSGFAGGGSGGGFGAR